MSTPARSVVVIGGGVVGASAAWRLAAAGLRVTLVEQFAPGHTRGASHGTSRIFRHAYAEPEYVQLAARASTGWRRLERLTGARIYEQTGAVDHGDPVTVQRLASALGGARIPFEILGTASAEKRWSGLRFDTVVLHHPDAGRLHADRAVAAFWQAAELAGARVRTGTTVRAVTERRGRVEVVLDDEVLTADQAVVAAGSWTGDLLADRWPLPALRTTQEQPLHFRSDLPADQWPSFIHHSGAGLDVPGGIYGLASVDGVKVGEHGTGPEVHPETRDSQPVQAGVERVREYARNWLPGVDVDSWTPVSCLYTTTPDHHFVIDRVGAVTVAAGFSGHGFKFGPVLGELVLDLVQERRPGLPLFSARSGRTVPVAD